MPQLCLLYVASNILFPSWYVFVVFVSNNFLLGVAYLFQIIYLVNDSPCKWSHTYIPRMGYLCIAGAVQYLYIIMWKGFLGGMKERGKFPQNRTKQILWGTSQIENEGVFLFSLNAIYRKVLLLIAPLPHHAVPEP